MQEIIVASNQLDYLCETSRGARLARACFKAAVFLRLIQPVLVFAAAALLLCAFSGLSCRCADRPTDHLRRQSQCSDYGIQNLVTLGVWLLIAAGIGGIGWALVNGMRRQSWGAQLIFGAACLGFGGIVALWNEYANGRSAVLPPF